MDIGDGLDKKVEFLSPNGWVSISKYNNQDILIYDDKKHITYFSRPLQYIKLRKEDIDNTSVYNTGINTIPNICNSGLDISDEEIRVLVMYLASAIDNSYKGKSECFIESSYRDRCIDLMNKARIQYITSEAFCGNGSMIMAFKSYNIDSLYSKLYYLSKNQLGVAVEEVINWSNSIDKDVVIGDLECSIGEDQEVITSIIDLLKNNDILYIYISKHKSKIDLLQFIFASASYNTLIFKDNDSYYNLIVTKMNLSGQLKQDNFKGKHKYLFEVSTGYWVIRREGEVGIVKTVMGG